MLRVQVPSVALISVPPHPMDLENLDVVSENNHMINYVLNKQLDSQKILKDIQELVNKTVTSHETYILNINIKKVSYDDTTLIPKLEHKILEPDCAT